MTRRIHTVRTKRRPWEEIQVDDATLLDLQRHGLIVEPDPEPDEPVEDVVAEFEQGEKGVTADPPPVRTPPASRRRNRG